MKSANLVSLVQIWAYFCLYSGSVMAGPIFGPQATAPTVSLSQLESIVFTTNYVFPNERHPQEAKNLLSRAPEGVYLSVGTERGFMGAAMAESLGLLLVDLNPGNQAYNHMNILLLKLSQTPEDLLELRKRPAYALSRLLASSDLSPVEKRFGKEILVSKWWEAVRDIYRRFSEFESPATAPGFMYGEANYLFNDQAWSHLKALAELNRIQVLNLNLIDAQAIIELQNQLHRQGEAVAVFDFSNAWQAGHVGMTSIQQALQKLSSVSRPDSVVLITQPATPGRGKAQWDYHSARIKDLQNSGFFAEDEKFKGRFLDYFPVKGQSCDGVLGK